MRFFSGPRRGIQGSGCMLTFFSVASSILNELLSSNGVHTLVEWKGSQFIDTVFTVICAFLEYNTWYSEKVTRPNENRLCSELAVEIYLTRWIGQSDLNKWTVSLKNAWHSSWEQQVVFPKTITKLDWVWWISSFQIPIVNFWMRVKVWNSQMHLHINTWPYVPGGCAEER